MKTDSDNCIASLTTAKTVAAISSIQITGAGSVNILRKIFRPAGKTVDFNEGNILHGFIFASGRDIDEVVIGCEGKDNFSINCHGNPLIVENILELLKRHGARVVEPEEIMMLLGRGKYGDNTIAVEADIAAAGAASLAGAQIIAHQLKMGLFNTAQSWLKNMNVSQIEDIGACAERILKDSRIADFFIRGVKVVIAGAPNSGKSTLFNYLCGKEKAIVTDIAGTTRDWLSAKVKLKKITAEFFDTAGLDEDLSEKNIIDSQSQKQAVDLINECDLVLVVVDCTNPAIVMAGLTEAKKKIAVFNKCDLIDKSAVAGLPYGVKISAKTGAGVNELIDWIEQSLGVWDFDLKKTVCFTERQKKILEQIASAETKRQIERLITELLKCCLVIS
ncbi:MAG: 50S ribosome-binding GTPase [Phycisphaerae bacterium]|nr:50S ribosome-binding GTPase [Phycisphaerae bacterium]